MNHEKVAETAPAGTCCSLETPSPETGECIERRPNEDIRLVVVGPDVERARELGSLAPEVEKWARGVQAVSMPAPDSGRKLRPDHRHAAPNIVVEQVRIDLSNARAGVAEKTLGQPEILGLPVNLDGEAVPRSVNAPASIQPGSCNSRLPNAMDCGAAEVSTALSHEQRIGSVHQLAQGRLRAEKVTKIAGETVADRDEFSPPSGSTDPGGIGCSRSEWPPLRRSSRTLRASRAIRTPRARWILLW